MAAQAQIRRMGFGAVGDADYNAALAACIDRKSALYERMGYSYTREGFEPSCRAEAEAASRSWYEKIDWSKLGAGISSGFDAWRQQQQLPGNVPGGAGYLPMGSSRQGAASWILPVGIGVGVLALAALYVAGGRGARA